MPQRLEIEVAVDSGSHMTASAQPKADRMGGPHLTRMIALEACNEQCVESTFELVDVPVALESTVASQPLHAMGPAACKICHWANLPVARATGQPGPALALTADKCTNKEELDQCLMGLFSVAATKGMSSRWTAAHQQQDNLVPSAIVLCDA